MVYTAERIKEVLENPELTSEKVREIPTSVPREGFGVVEAPRGVLIHHYITDERGIIKRANLLVATQHNAARISLSIDEAAKSFIRRGEVDEGILNMIEMAFRAYDPCYACATHSLLEDTIDNRIDERRWRKKLVSSPEDSMKRVLVV